MKNDHGLFVKPSYFNTSGFYDSANIKKLYYETGVYNPYYKVSKNPRFLCASKDTSLVYYFFTSSRSNGSLVYLEFVVKTDTLGRNGTYWANTIKRAQRKIIGSYFEREIIRKLDDILKYNK